MEKLLLLSMLLFVSINAFTQHSIPILHSNTNVLTIRDGDQLRENYWQVSPEVELDVYVADKINKNKNVVFYSDIDSISFELNPP